jgi:predicted nucleotidyltransferase
MLSEQDTASIVACARRHGARTVLLFGSAAGDAQTYHDIDLAVDGVSPGRFFGFHGEFLRHLYRPVDLVDLSEHSPSPNGLRGSGSGSMVGLRAVSDRSVRS